MYYLLLVFEDTRKQTCGLYHEYIEMPYLDLGYAGHEHYAVLGTSALRASKGSSIPLPLQKSPMKFTVTIVLPIPPRYLGI